jgi:predicted GTPase
MATSLSPGPSLVGARVLVVEEGRTLIDFGRPFGAGTMAARDAGATRFVDPRPYAVGSIADAYARHPAFGLVLPLMSYTAEHLADLAQTVRAVRCDVVVIGTPVDLTHLVRIDRPTRRAKLELCSFDEPTLADLIGARLAGWRRPASARSWRTSS